MSSDILRIAGSFRPRTNTAPLAGFAEVVPQFEPPWLPGIWIVSRMEGGVKIPSLRALSTTCFHLARSSEVRIYGLISSAVNFWTEKGGGLTGNGCVGQACSPGISLLGTGRSSMGQRGAPVERLNT